MYLAKALRRTLICLLLPVGSLTAQRGAIDSTTESLTFRQALQRAIAADPRLALNTSQAEAAEGQIEQAGLRPNPVITAEVENFLGTGPLAGIDGLEITLGLSQVIETAQKRARRTTLAQAERRLIDWERQELRSQIEHAVRVAFIDVLLCQKRIELGRDQWELAQRSAVETSRLVEAARSPQVELTRAQLAVQQQQLALQQAERAYATARSILNQYFTKPIAPQIRLLGEIQLEAALPAFTDLTSQLTRTPALERYAAEAQSREAALALEQARATPDIELFAGGRYFNEDAGDMSFLVGVEIPWPLFNKNQGNIRSARAALRAVEHERAVRQRELRIALNRAYQQLCNAHAEATAIVNDLLPAAEATLREMETGYQRGQFQQLAVLESRRTLFALRESYLNALHNYAAAQADIEALTRPATY